jgi:hypothetical protein
LESRIKRLERRIIATPKPLKLCAGFLRRLPEDYERARHIVIVEHLGKERATSMRSAFTRSVPGTSQKAKPTNDDPKFRYIDMLLVAPYPRKE